jgi:[acyl-carrier-protein] S-malonyltransferase
MTDIYGVVFPGQGSQSVGMMAELHSNFPLVQDTFKEASDALGFDLWALISNGPAEDLNLTHNTQPAMLASGVAVWRVLLDSGLKKPDFMAGHSLGEYTALVAAGALDFADAIKLVALRGRLMQEAVPEGQGAMAAILGLEDDAIRDLCTQAAEGDIVEPVNFNSPGQVVIAGNTAAVERAMALAKEAGAKRALPLPVSAPSHCSLMKPAAEKLAENLAGIRISMPTIPVIHNANVSKASSTAQIADLLTRQLYSPVRWVETIKAFSNDGIELIIEAGPGKVLSGLCKRIDKSVTGMGVFDQASLDKVLETLDA